MFKKLFFSSAYARKTIVRDLLLWLVLLVFCVVSFAAVSYYVYSKDRATAKINSRADSLIGELSSMLSVPLYNLDIDGVSHISRIYSQMPDLQGIRVENELGKVIFNSLGEEEGSFTRQTTVYQGELFLGKVSLALSNSQYLKQRRYILILLFCTGVSLVLAMAVGIHFIMNYILTKPLQEFNRSLLDIAGGDYSTRLESVRHVDLDSSVTAVNMMAGKIEKAVGELKVTRDFLQNVLNSMPSVMIGVDSQCCITNLNSAAVLGTELRRSKCKGRPIAEVFPCLEGEVSGNIIRSMAEHKPITIEQRNSPIFGDRKHVEITVYPLRSVTGGAVVRVDDISSRVRLQKVMVQTEKMMSVGSLGAGMAHEINNPLGGILQATQNIERRISPTFPKNREVAEQCGVEIEAVANYLEQRQVLSMLTGIREAGQRAATIVQNMLKFSHSSDSALERCLLADILDRVLELAANDYDLKRKYDFKNFTIHRDFSADIVVECSRTEIEQVFLNLLKNAAQAFAADDLKNGLLPEISITVKEDEDFVTIEVADNGPGIEEEVQKRIFEPFFTTKKVGEGTGLGLAVSYYIIVDQHGGDLSVESIPGQGATFTVKLPAPGTV